MAENHKYKKYIVFAYDDYYPSGGLNDIKDSFDTLEEARKYVDYENKLIALNFDNKEIADRDTWEIID